MHRKHQRLQQCGNLFLVIDTWLKKDFVGFLVKMKKINLWHDSPLINKNSQKLRAHIIETTSYFMDKKRITILSNWIVFYISMLLIRLLVSYVCQ